MSVWGGLLTPLSSQIKKCLNLIRESNQHFSKTSEIQNKLESSEGGVGRAKMGIFLKFYHFLYLPIAKDDQSAQIPWSRPFSRPHRPPCVHFGFYRWCGVAGGERMPPAPLGWYLYQLLQMLVLHYYLLLCPLPCPTNLCLTSQHSSISALMSDYGLQISTTNYAPRTPNLIRLIRIQ